MLLKKGDKVRVYHFTPRKPKVNPGESVQWEGREQWFESAWLNETVDSLPCLPTHPEDGVHVKLKGRMLFWNARKMELA